MTEEEPVRRQLVLAICCLSVFIAGIDGTIVNIALPSIRRSFHASVTDLQWTIDAYTLVIACLLMLSGSMADRFGRRRVFQLGLGFFSAGSLLCSVAPGVGWLIAFRSIQAIGGSMLNPVAMSIIVNTFTEPRGRAKATGVWGSVAGLSLAVGPVVGGFLVSGIGWRSIFWLNVPIGIATIVLTQRFVPESKSARARAFDPIGQILVAVIFATVTSATIEGPHRGWSSATTLGSFAIGSLAVGGLVRTERRRRDPLIDVRFFKSAPFTGAIVIAVLAFGALGGFLFLNTLYLQNIRGESALGAGVLTIPMALTFAVSATVAGRIVATRGPRPPLMIAGPLFAIASLMFSRLSPHTSILYLVVGYVIFGIGAGQCTAPITNTAISGMPVDQAGVAGAIVSSGRQFGSALGVAVTGSLVAAAVGARFTSGSRLGWDVIAACGVAIFVVGTTSTGRWALSTASRNRERLARDLESAPREHATA